MIMHINVQNFNSSFKHLRVLLHNQQDYPSVPAFTDMWFTCNNLCDLERYQAHNVLGTNRLSGGVSVCVKEDYSFKNSEVLPFCGTTTK